MFDVVQSLDKLVKDFPAEMTAFDILKHNLQTETLPPDKDMQYRKLAEIYNEFLPVAMQLFGQIEEQVDYTDEYMTKAKRDEYNEHFINHGTQHQLCSMIDLHKDSVKEVLQSGLEDVDNRTFNLKLVIPDQILSVGDNFKIEQLTKNLLFSLHDLMNIEYVLNDRAYDKDSQSTACSETFNSLAKRLVSSVL